MVTKAKKGPRKCPDCGRGKKAASAKCSRCVNALAVAGKRHEGGAAAMHPAFLACPARLSRIAMYRERAAEGLPLFEGGRAT